MGRVEQILVDEVAQPLRMQGQYYDKELDLCYNRYRYFDPATCSFISQDPLGLAAGENVYAYCPNVWKWVDPLGLKCEEIPNAEELALNRAEILRNSMSRRKQPRATSVAVDTRTGKAYTGDSGKRLLESDIHPTIRERMPNPSLERWPVNNCAEFNSVNKALKDGAKLEDLHVHTVTVRNGTPFPRCRNCRITTDGVIVTSD